MFSKELAIKLSRYLGINKYTISLEVRNNHFIS